MIPESVYDGVKNAQNYNCGAELVRGNRTYSLSHGHGRVKAILFITCDSDKELPALEAAGYTVSKGTPRSLQEKCPHFPVYPPLAWKSIPISHVPDSIADEWDEWDEY